MGRFTGCGSQLSLGTRPSWNCFLEIGFVAASSNPCVFVRRRGSSMILIIVLYVDDLLTGNSEPELQLLKMKIGGRFRVKDLGEAAHLFGMRVPRDDSAGMVHLDQAANPRRGLTGIELPWADDADGPALDSGDYRNIVGSLMNAAPATATATPATATAAASLELVGYSDAYLAECLDSGRFTIGGPFLLAGGVLAFSSRLQHSVAQSTMESEYMALFDASQEVEQLRMLLAHLSVEQTAPTLIHEDNTAALAVAMAAGHMRQSRHIRIRYHFTRELVAAGVIVVEQVITADQLADGLTKNVGLERLLALRART
ncbi:unnamed protein product, partial [Phaeothamnion confervicola]